MCSDAPDMSGANAAALQNAKLSREALDFYKKVYADEAPTRARASETALKVADAQLASMTQQDALSKEYADYNRETFRPLEKSIVADAQNYDTAERREAEAGTAVADVGIQAANARQQVERNQQRMGVNPNSGAAVALTNQLSLGEAAAKAGAANTARKNVETIGFARKMDAAGLGRNLASNSSTAASVALNAGNSATGNASAPVAQGQSAADLMGKGFSTAIQGNNSAGQLYAQAAQISGQDSGMWGALGSVAGGFLGGRGFEKMISSDKKQKHRGKKVKPELSLAQIRRLPDAETYVYRDDSPAADGGVVHTGHMAQDVNKAMGDEVAPGGEVIDVQSALGHTFNAVKALDKRLLSLEHARKA